MPHGQCIRGQQYPMTVWSSKPHSPHIATTGFGSVGARLTQSGIGGITGTPFSLARSSIVLLLVLVVMLMESELH